MKIQLKKIIIAIAIILLTISCDNSLDEKVYSTITESSYNYSEKEIYNVIGNAYPSMREFFRLPHNNYWGLQEQCSDVIVMPANASGWDNEGVMKRMHWHKWNSDQVQISGFWDAAYAGIINSNRIIDQLQKGIIPVGAGVNIDALIAEMKVSRAFYYWLLMDNHGDIPLITGTSQDLPEKAARSEIYQFLVSELNKSIPSLSEEKGSLWYGRFNKWAAKALLANIYLNAQIYNGKAEWDNCMKECNDIINSNKYQLEKNYKDVFKEKNETSPEIIFAIPFDLTYADGWRLIQISLHAASKATFQMQSTPFGAGSAKGIPQFIDTYDNKDERLTATWIMGPQFRSDGVTPILGSYDKQGKQINYTKNIPNGEYTGEDEGYRIGKFEIVAGYRDLNNDFPFFRYAEVLMMKAECLLRKGQADEAASIVTQIRIRAFKNNPEKANVTGDQLKNNSSYKYGFVENYNIVDFGNSDKIEFGRFYDELGYEFVYEFDAELDVELVHQLASKLDSKLEYKFDSKPDNELAV